VGNKGRPSINKRLKEAARKERAAEKIAKKAERAVEKEGRPPSEGDDPDIAGIVPGPQPPLEEFQD
jgi:hypothetical protein